MWPNRSQIKKVRKDVLLSSFIYRIYSYSFLYGLHSPLDSIPHIFGRMHAPVHRRTCIQHKYARTHVPSPVDSSANVLLLFFRIFSVFSSVCSKIFTYCGHRAYTWYNLVHAGVCVCLNIMLKSRKIRQCACQNPSVPYLIILVA